MSPLKKCNKCTEDKPLEDFYPRFGKEKYKTTKAGYQDCCKLCWKDRQGLYVVGNIDKVKECDTNSRLKRVYGIDLTVYNQMFADQEGKCLGCKKHQSELKFKLAIDHCHTSGKIRGLLCINCNAALGQVRDDVSVLENLIKYLNNNDENQNSSMKVGTYGQP